jgi:hypothetical protein
MPNREPKSMVTLTMPQAMYQRLVESVEGCDYCYLCDCHPGEEHDGHAKDCPLYHEPKDRSA